jgi:hypothetical protein
MLPSITNSLVPLAAAPIAAAAQAGAVTQAVAKGAAAARPAAADALIGLALDSAVDVLGALATSPAAKASKPSTSSSKGSGAGYANAASTSSKASTSKSTSTAKKAGPLAFLDDSKLSVEEKLMRLLAYLNDKWDKDLDKKMKELQSVDQPAAKSSSSSGGTPRSSGGGLLGSVASLVNVAKQFFPQVGIAMSLLENPVARAALSKLGGPVLAAAATAAGFPQLAPLALRYGSTLVDVAVGVATSLGTEAASGDGASSVSAGPIAAATTSAATTSAATSGSTGSTSGAGTLSSDRKAQVKLMEIQRIMDQQKEMFSLVSNCLRTGHDTRMAIIQNVR